MPIRSEVHSSVGIAFAMTPLRISDAAAGVPAEQGVSM
jgi:hypothetical protein